MARWTTLGGYPVKQYQSPNRGGAMDGHRGVVCHIAEGTYLGTISWQMNPDQTYASGGTVTTCSTWIVGKQRGEIAQMVDTDEIAWCQRSGSRTWLSIEFAGYNTGALTEWQIEAAALILAAVHEHYGVPLQVAPDPSVRGLGHHSMDREWLGEEWGHDDCPGPQIIAQKPQIVAQAITIATGDDMLDLTQQVPIDVVDGQVKTAPLGLWLRTVAIRTGYLGNVFTAEVRKTLTEILAEAKDDAQVTVTGSPELLAKLDALHERVTAMETALPALTADAVNDDAAARLAD